MLGSDFGKNGGLTTTAYIETMAKPIDTASNARYKKDN
jgi:hypothetical protein